MCQYNPNNVGAKSRGMVRIQKGSESDLLAAVAIVGPVTVGIDHNHAAFQVPMHSL